MAEMAKPDSVNDIVSDLSRVPNFEAVDLWLDKLKAWCIDATEKIAEFPEKTVAELEDQVVRLAQENADLEFRADIFDELVELFFDMRRGIREPGEIEGWLKDKGFEA
jgi:uncharacterized protein CbrC (UPF0167 family)